MHDGAHVAPTLTLPTAPPPRPQVVHVYNDAHAALEYYAEGRPGCVLVAGTGARAGPARRVFERAALARRPAQAGLTRPRARARGRLDRHGQGRRAGHPARGRLGAGVPRRRQRLRPGCGPGCPARAGPDARPGAVQGRTPRRPAAHERRHVRGDAARPRGAAARDVACARMPIGFRVWHDVPSGEACVCRLGRPEPGRARPQGSARWRRWRARATGAARAPRWPPRCASTARSGTWPACWGARTGRRVCRVQPPSSHSLRACRTRCK